ncbi:hypothetical protein ACFMI4_18075 [Acinetobacter baumannii]
MRFVGIVLTILTIVSVSPFSQARYLGDWGEWEILSEDSQQ